MNYNMIFYFKIKFFKFLRYGRFYMNWNVVEESVVFLGCLDIGLEI